MDTSIKQKTNIDTNQLRDELYPDGTTARTQMSRAEIEITNQRYHDDPFWAGPKGLEYGRLVGAKPNQVPRLFPDRGATYFVAKFHLPRDASLTVSGVFPHMRYFSYTLASVQGGVIGTGPFIRDNEIQPDNGSINPFMPGHSRDVHGQTYTLEIVNGKRPPLKTKEAKRKDNTLYTGHNSYDRQIYLAMRNYISDAGYDGTGNVPLVPVESENYGLPKIALYLPGKPNPITGEEMIKILRPSKEGNPAEYQVKQWLGLIDASSDKTNAPARPAPMFQRFWNIDYSVTGAFVKNPKERAALFPATDSGGFANNPDTVYMAAPFSLGFGSHEKIADKIKSIENIESIARIAVVRAKMPTHQSTRHHQRTWTPDTDVRYWSVSTGGTPPSGLGWHSLFDEEVPVDDEGYFTIVMSWPEDRPKNAIKEHGVAWIPFGDGEGHYVGGRTWINIMYMRYTDSNPTWAESPKKIPPPTPENPIPQDPFVMKEYYPRARYMTKGEFERLGDNPTGAVHAVFEQA